MGWTIVFPDLAQRLSTWMLAASLAVATCAVPQPLRAQSATGPQVKAAFVLNFAKFVSWPATRLPENQPIVIGIIGSNAVADALARLAAGKTADGHPIQVKRNPTGNDISRVHVLFIGDAEWARVPGLLKLAGTGSVLTVSDAPRFCSLGGMIQLRDEDDRIRFDIDHARAQDAALEVNSKLLSLAGSVNPPKSN